MPRSSCSRIWLSAKCSHPDTIPVPNHFSDWFRHQPSRNDGKNTSRRNQALAQDFNPDVDRALVALAASPMLYRSFVTSPAGPAGTGQIASHMVTPEQSPEPQRALGFPLLLAALPEIAQLSMPKAPPLENTTPPRVRTQNIQRPIQEPVAPMTARAAATSIRPQPRTPSPVFQSRYEPARPAPRQDLPASSASDHSATNLAAVFHGLQTKNSPRRERTEVKSDLQEMFSRL